jgi:hypothetical protein
LILNEIITIECSAVDLVKGRHNLLEEYSGLHFAFPNRENSPAHRLKCVALPPISFNIRREFLRPEFASSLGKACGLAPLVPVPKAPVDEDYSLSARKHEIRGSGQTINVKPKSKSSLM